MKSYEAIQEAVAGKTIEHAKALRLATSTLHKWQEPATDFTDSGSLNPLDRIETIIRTAIHPGKSENPYAPIFYLAEQFGLVMIPMPHSTRCMKELTLSLIRAINDFSDLTKGTSMALEDGKISRIESKLIEKDGWELVRQVAELIAKAKEMAKN